MQLDVPTADHSSSPMAKMYDDFHNLHAEPTALLDELKDHLIHFILSF
jgi:hypothetical protein